jgi:hypothetical protein
MLEKIRLHQRDELDEYYFELLGSGFDGRLCRYLGVGYADVVERVKGGTSDEEVLAWVQGVGLELTEERVEVWNGFVSKRGWNDDGSVGLEAFKKEVGFEGRTDIQTYLQFIEVDEGRRP